MELLTLSIIFIISGLLAGFIAGLFGLGGGSVLVPLFIFLLPKFGAKPDVVMYQAVGTSLAIIMPNALSASFKQYRLNNLKLQKVLKTWIPYVLLGCILSVFIFYRLSSFVLQVGFMIYLALCAVYMYFKKVEVNKTNDEKIIPAYSRCIAGIIVGFISTCLGIGGGTFTVPYYLANNYSSKAAIAISSFSGLFIGAAGFLAAIYFGLGNTHVAHFSVGYVNIPAFISIAIFSVFSATYGVTISHKLSERTIKVLYIGFLVIIVGSIFYETFFYQY